MSRDIYILKHIVVDSHLVPLTTMTARPMEPCLSELRPHSSPATDPRLRPVAESFDRTALPQIIRNYGSVEGVERGGDRQEIPIVRRTWLDACLREKRLVDTEPYIIHGVPFSEENAKSLSVKRPSTVDPPPIATRPRVLAEAGESLSRRATPLPVVASSRSLTAHPPELWLRPSSYTSAAIFVRPSASLSQIVNTSPSPPRFDTIARARSQQLGFGSGDGGTRDFSR